MITLVVSSIYFTSVLEFSNLVLVFRLHEFSNLVLVFLLHVGMVHLTGFTIQSDDNRVAYDSNVGDEDDYYDDEPIEGTSSTGSKSFT